MLCAQPHIDREVVAIALDRFENLAVPPRHIFERRIDARHDGAANFTVNQARKVVAVEHDAVGLVALAITLQRSLPSA